MVLVLPSPVLVLSVRIWDEFVPFGRAQGAAAGSTTRGNVGGRGKPFQTQFQPWERGKGDEALALE